jgi:hypothetical protein
MQRLTDTSALVPARQRGNVRDSSGGLEGALTVPWAQHCLNATYESPARPRGSQRLSRFSAKCQAWACPRRLVNSTRQGRTNPRLDP